MVNLRRLVKSSSAKNHLHYDKSYLIANIVKTTLQSIFEKDHSKRGGQTFHTPYEKRREEWLQKSIQRLNAYESWIESEKATTINKLHMQGVDIKNILDLIELREKRLINKLKIVFNEEFFSELYEN